MNFYSSKLSHDNSNPKMPGRILIRFLGQMGLSFGVILISFFTLISPQETGQAAALANSKLACQPFSQVNDGAFSLGTGINSDYSSEEGFEVLVANGQLYVGMEADNSMGARLWRTKKGTAIPASQADWEEVAADSNGKPFGVDNVTQNDHIDSLAEFNGYIFASTANGGSKTYGTLVFRSPTGDPGTWENALAAYGDGFGSVFNTNFKDMAVFQGQLCGGTQNWATGTQVWCTPDGATWKQKNISGFGQGYQNTKNVETWSSYVFNGSLYIGVQNLGLLRSNSTDDEAKIYRTADLNGTPTWSEVFGGPAGSVRADLLGELDGDLYIATRSANGLAILRSSTGNPGSWVQVNIAGMDGNIDNSGTIVDGATAYNNALYIAVSNITSGFELWRTSGVMQPGSAQVDWEQVGGSGLGDTKNIHAELIPFNGYLYAWTSNYARGQKVMKTECGYEQTIQVSQTAVDYVFDPEIGATIRFADLGTVSHVTIKAYPGAWDLDGLIVGGVVPVKRHYTISVDGSGYLTDVVLAYDQLEFDESSIQSESTTYQAVWTGSNWAACPATSRTRDPVANTVACNNMTDLSKLTITGQASPSAMELTGFSAAAQNNIARVSLLVTAWLLFASLAWKKHCPKVYTRN